MAVIQMGNPLMDALGAAGAYMQQGFQNNQNAQLLALAKLKQEQDNAIAQGQLGNQTALVQPQIAHMGAETNLLGQQAAGQGIQNQYAPGLAQATINHTNAQAGLTTAQTAGQNLTNRTIIPTAQADIGLKGAMGSLYGSEAQHNQAETNTLIPAQAALMSAQGQHENAATGLTNEQTTLMQKMGVLSKNGTVNAANAWQVINTDPYLKNVVPSWMGQNPQLVAGSPAFQNLAPAQQAAVMAILNQPGVRKDVASPVQTQDAALKHAGSIVNMMYGSPTDFNSAAYKMTQGNPASGLALMKLNAAVAQMIQKVGKMPTSDQITQVLQAAASGHPQWGIDQASAQTLLTPLNLPAAGGP